MTSERFLVPTDFSPDADGALRYAITLGKPFQAHLVLLHVRDDAALNPWSYSGGAEAALSSGSSKCKSWSFMAQIRLLP